MTTLWPNKSPEPTAVGAVSSAIAVHGLSSRVAELFTLGHKRAHEHIHDHYCSGGRVGRAVRDYTLVDSAPDEFGSEDTCFCVVFDSVRLFGLFCVF